jgi:hypothetical protein
MLFESGRSSRLEVPSFLPGGIPARFFRPQSQDLRLCSSFAFRPSPLPPPPCHMFGSSLPMQLTDDSLDFSSLWQYYLLVSRSSAQLCRLHRQDPAVRLQQPRRSLTPVVPHECSSRIRAIPSTLVLYQLPQQDIDEPFIVSNDWRWSRRSLLFTHYSQTNSKSFLTALGEACSRVSTPIRHNPTAATHECLSLSHETEKYHTS